MSPFAVALLQSALQVASTAAPADVAAAREFLTESRIEMQLREAIVRTRPEDVLGELGLCPEAAPMLQTFTSKAIRITNETLDFDALMSDLAGSFAKEFTAAELRELTTFYRSPLGRKLAERTPPLAQRARELAEAQFARGQPRMDELFEAHAEDLQRAEERCMPREQREQR